MFLWVYVYVYDITVRGEGNWKIGRRDEEGDYGVREGRRKEIEQR